MSCSVGGAIWTGLITFCLGCRADLRSSSEAEKLSIQTRKLLVLELWHVRKNKILAWKIEINSFKSWARCRSEKQNQTALIVGGLEVLKESGWNISIWMDGLFHRSLRISSAVWENNLAAYIVRNGRIKIVKPGEATLEEMMRILKTPWDDSCIS